MRGTRSDRVRRPLADQPGGDPSARSLHTLVHLNLEMLLAECEKATGEDGEAERGGDPDDDQAEEVGGGHGRRVLRQSTTVRSARHRVARAHEGVDAAERSVTRGRGRVVWYTRSSDLRSEPSKPARAAPNPAASCCPWSPPACLLRAALAAERRGRFREERRPEAGVAEMLET